MSMFDKIAADASAEAKALSNEVEVLARLLAQKMRALHGDPYRVQIDHELGFVVVRASR